MNSVLERRNRTLKDMVRSMICHSTLPESFWGKTFKIAVYILNIVLQIHLGNDSKVERIRLFLQSIIIMLHI